MQSEESSQVLQVKMDNEDCSHRIVELIWHQNCTKSAQLCEKNCISNQHHDFPKYSHQKITIEEFRNLFFKLQQSCSRQTHHYIRQINDIEKIAQENIKKKKQQLFKEIQQVKSFIMKNAYKDLQYRFVNLYQKYKGQRYESLKCNEVCWVAKTQITSHSIKHSVINSKLEAILKKFQNFKEVSKNYVKPMQKQKAKEVKLNEKLQESMIKVFPSLKLPRPDYSLQALTIDRRKIKDLEEKLKVSAERILNLTDYVTKLVNKQRQKIQRLSIFRIADEVKIQSLIKYVNEIQSQNEGIINRMTTNGQSKTKEGIFLNILNKNIMNTLKTNASQVNDQILSNQRIQRRISLSIPQMNPQQFSKSQRNATQRSGQIIFPQISVNFNLKQSPSRNHSQSDEKNISGSHLIQRPYPPLSPQYPKQRAQIQPEINLEPLRLANMLGQSHQKSISHWSYSQHQSQIIWKRQNSQNEKQNRQEEVQPIVKSQQKQFVYEKWNTEGLIQQMKKHGQNQQSGLKVENIDILRRFPTLHLQKPRSLQVPRSLMPGNLRSRPQHTSTYNLYALELFDKQVRKKQGPTPAKQ